MYTRSCFFIGHRSAPESLRDVLAEAVERHIAEYGVNEFFVGHYGGFDRLAVSVVRSAKRRHSHIKLFELIPYHPALRTTPLLEGTDGTFYPPGMERVPKRAAIVRANRYMADCCDYLIVYAYAPGGAKGLLDYARRRPGLHIENLADTISEPQNSLLF